MREVDIYTAGIIDGEGSIMLLRKSAGNRFRYPTVSVTSTTFELIEFLRENYGGSACKQKVYKDHHKESWSWRMRGDQALKFLKRVRPWMIDPLKVKRADLLLSEYKSVTIRNGKYNDEQLEAKRLFEERFYDL